MGVGDGVRGGAMGGAGARGGSRRVRSDVLQWTGEPAMADTSAPLDPATVAMRARRWPPSRSTIALAILHPMLPMGRATTEHTPTQPRPTKSATWRTEAPCHTLQRTPPGPPPGLRQAVGPGIAHAHNEDENGNDSAVCTVVALMMTRACVLSVNDDVWLRAHGCGGVPWRVSCASARPVPSPSPASPSPHVVPPPPSSLPPFIPPPRSSPIGVYVSVDVVGTKDMDTHTARLPYMLCMAVVSAAGVFPSKFVTSVTSKTPAGALHIIEGPFRKLGAPVCRTAFRTRQSRSAPPVAASENEGGSTADGRVGVHDGVTGSTRLSAWKPTPRLALRMFDDDAMTMTKMP